MTIRIHKTDVYENCIRIDDIQILFLSGSISSGAEKRIDFPQFFLDKNYAVTVSGNYGSALNIANKYNDCIFLNVAGSGAYNTGKYEIIAIGKWK